MRRVERDLDIPLLAGPSSSPLRVDTLTDKWVEVGGDFVGSLTVEGRFSSKSDSWVELGTANAGTPAFIEVKPPFYELRLNTTNVVSGAPFGRLSALDQRTT